MINPSSIESISNASESILGEAAQKLYDEISERLAFGGEPLRVVDVENVGDEKTEAAETLNKLYYKLGSLLDELAYQASEDPQENLNIIALREIAVITEFTVQLAEGNPGMKFVEDPEGQAKFSARGDNIRAWRGTFSYGNEQVQFGVFIRPRTFEVMSGEKVAALDESRQARMAVHLMSRRGNIEMRIDPEYMGRVCFDIDGAAIDELEYQNVGQEANHHFYTDTYLNADSFADVLELLINVVDERA